MKQERQDIISQLVDGVESNPWMSQGEQAITHAIWQQLHRNHALKIEELAIMAQTSPATINRYAKKFGFNGFLPLKRELLESWQANQKKEIRMSRAAYHRFQEDHQQILAYNFELVRQGLNDTENAIDIATLEQTVRLFGVANAIHFIGVDYSHLVAKDAQQKFMRLGKMCTAHRDLQVYLQEAALQERDVVVIFSFSGQTRMGKRVAQKARRQGVQVILITANMTGSLAENATQIIQIAGEENVFTESSTSGRIILHTVMDSIYLLYGTLNNKNLVITE